MGQWPPTTVLRFLKGISSSACTAVVETDAGHGYLKALGAPEGPHTLACEWVATHLAAWFNLATFDVAIPFYKKGKRFGQASPGPAFIARAEAGETWSGKEKQLRRLINPQDISRLIVFDTWTLNCDRYSHRLDDPLGKPRVNRNNVFLSQEAPAGQFVLKAIDHTHCFTCGRALTTKVTAIDTIKDARVFGLFPQFRPFLDPEQVEQAVADLRQINRADVRSITQTIPRQWDVARDVQEALIDLIVRRAAFVADTITANLWPQTQLPLEE